MQCKCGGEMRPAVARRREHVLSYSMCNGCERCGGWVLRQEHEDLSTTTLIVGEEAKKAYQHLQKHGTLPSGQIGLF